MKSRTLFCMSGGGVYGLYNLAGMLAALDRREIYASACAGTSAGAIASAMYASGMDAPSMCDFLLALEDRDIIRGKTLWKLRLKWLYGILRSEPIKELLESLLPDSFSHLEIPLQVHVTDWYSHLGEDIVSGDLRTAVLASMAIQGVFDPVELDGRMYCDGGTSANLPLPDDWHSYDAVYLLICTSRSDEMACKPGILTNLMRNMHAWALDQIADPVRRVGLDIGRVRAFGFDTALRGSTRVTAIWPPYRAKRGFLKVDHEALHAADKFTTSALAGG